MVRDYAGGVVVYCRARMKLSLVRLVATLLLTGQVLPVGLPLLCDQVQRTTSANCDQQMASHMSGRVVAATTRPDMWDAICWSQFADVVRWTWSHNSGRPTGNTWPVSSSVATNLTSESFMRARQYTTTPPA